MPRLCFAVVFLAAAPASAKVLDLYGQAQGGGGMGRGVGGPLKEADFFDAAAGGTYGVKVGAEVVFLDAWVEHNQFRDGEGLAGTWTQFMGGFDVDFALGDDSIEGKKPTTYGEIGFAVGFGLGTGAQVDPPLDNGEISDKGFLAQMSFGGDYRLNSVLSIGLGIPITYGYLLKQDSMSVSNDETRWYHSVSAAALLYLRFHVQVK